MDRQKLALGGTEKVGKAAKCCGGILTNLKLRLAAESDIPEMHKIRMSVVENRLSDPLALTYADYVPYIAKRGESWIQESDTGIAGFASINWHDASLWALFVDPQMEGRGIGQTLFTRLIERASEMGLSKISLTTTPGTRAEAFYLRQGWETVATEENGEVRMILDLKLGSEIKELNH